MSELTQITLPTIIVTQTICQMEESLQELCNTSHFTPIVTQHHDTLRRLRGIILVGALLRFLRCFEVNE